MNKLNKANIEFFLLFTSCLPTQSDAVRPEVYLPFVLFNELLPPLLFLPAVPLESIKTRLESQKNHDQETEKWPFSGLQLDLSAGSKVKSFSSSSSLQFVVLRFSRPQVAQKIWVKHHFWAATQKWFSLLISGCFWNPPRLSSRFDRALKTRIAQFVWNCFLIYCDSNILYF